MGNVFLFFFLNITVKMLHYVYSQEENFHKATLSLVFMIMTDLASNFGILAGSLLILMIQSWQFFPF